MAVIKSVLVASTLLTAALGAPAIQVGINIDRRRDVAGTSDSTTAAAQSPLTANASQLSAASAAASALAPPGVSVVTVVVTLTPSAASKPSSEASVAQSTPSSTTAALPMAVPDMSQTSQSSPKPITYRPPPPPPPPPKGFGQAPYGQTPVPPPVMTVYPAYSQQAATRPYPRPANAGPSPDPPGKFTTTITRTLRPQKPTAVFGSQGAATYAPRPAQALPYNAPRPAPVPARPQPRPRPAQPRPYQPPGAIPIPQAYQPMSEQPYQQLQPYPQPSYPQQPDQLVSQPYGHPSTAAEGSYEYPAPVQVSAISPGDGDHFDDDLAPPGFPALSEEAGIYQELGPVILPQGLLDEADASSADAVVIEPADED